MKIHLLLLAAFWLASGSAFSQDSLHTGLSPDSSIRATLVQGYRYPRLVYSANGKVLDRREILARLRLYEAPAGELERFKNARTTMLVCLGAMLASGIGAGVERNQDNPGAQYTMAGIAVGAAVGALIAGAESARHLDRAIKRYNKRFSF
jgi:hypothetical protein